MQKTSALPITLKVGENAYRIDVGVNTLCDVEQEFDLGIYALTQKFADAANLRVTDVRRFLKVTLRDEAGQRMPEERVNEAANSAGLKEVN